MRKPFARLFRSMPLALLVALAVVLPAAPANAPARAPQNSLDGQLAQCLTLQGNLSKQATALAELQARTQMVASQRALEQARHDGQIQALQNEKHQLLYLASIAILVLLLAAATGFGLILRKRHQQLRQLSEADALTGLSNRHAATAELNAMVAQRGPEGTRHVLFLIDIDHFKQINDTHGHHVGDDVLVAMATRLKAACRPTDLVARWGGEEFLVACSNLTREQAEQVATRLRQAMTYTLETAHSCRLITVSLGLAPIPFFDMPADNSAANRWDYALRMADRALYAAKRNRDAWVGYWGAQLPDDATAEAILEQPEAATRIVTVMSSLPRIVSMASARARSLRAVRAQT